MNLRERLDDLLIEKKNDVYAVDLDGTLAKHTTWNGPTSIGEPIPRMVKRVKRYLSNGQKVVIFTARAAHGASTIKAIKAWCKEHLGQELPVTNIKTKHMVKFLDDRAEQIQRNTGKPIK